MFHFNFSDTHKMISWGSDSQSGSYSPTASMKLLLGDWWPNYIGRQYRRIEIDGEKS
jgi:hypothetical protein